MSKFDPHSFGRKLRAAREELELTQAEMSLRSISTRDPSDRISSPYISTLERGERSTRPSEPMLDAISRGLGHDDPWIVREWAGLERAPDHTTTLRAIANDRSLRPKDRRLFTELYMRFTGLL